jgi:hypothetical protein
LPSDATFHHVSLATKRHALRAINQNEMGLCANCIAELVAKAGWDIVTKAERF